LRYCCRIALTLKLKRLLAELAAVIALEKQTLTILNSDELQRCSEFDPLYLHMDADEAA
jgi:hypothetical protein